MSLLMQSPDVELSFPQQPEGSNLFSGTKRGTLVLTSHRVIFLTSRSVNDPMLSFMMPFDLMKNCTVEQPVFAANYIKGTIQAAPDGGWEGQAIFKLVFIRGGAITFAKLMSKAASAAAQGVPLRPVNAWFGPIQIFVTSQGNMCTPQTPCSVIVYGAPPMGYGTLPPENRAPPMGNEGLPVGNGASPVGYGAPPVGYGAPPVGYGAPPVGYGAPPVGYGAPPVGYGAPPPGYRAPPMGYGAPPAGSVAAQTPENGASLPSTSSQAHSPPSKI
ncbi:postacrosomal sheath WW domain-binding protein isoform X2 [Microcebus murinus]|uniref:postacrosomal sheath WW domain-binding protein isoform X2 n=1 Tax=Microcebus murinus TaxID=30608 RepID=UPI000642936D|nr:postacrosomal sheath WW domain-binding protein isoform X2 [Microcebus murinus]XP_012597320.1 postacrosomal sheath WW domain-binding protein isoform X2 [Microcebus murinus]XP_012597321.1 postacrosomal sheath WW domain-binding protein isoform X2 [Microcebus murinus]XP_020143389.1 postacrosomal sheath WW domain-binding protein isoform X2 [Microcebus murinus]